MAIRLFRITFSHVTAVQLGFHGKFWQFGKLSLLHHQHILDQTPLDAFFVRTALDIGIFSFGSYDDITVASVDRLWPVRI